MTRNGFRNFFVAPRTWRARFGVFFGGLCVLAACGVIRYCWGTAAAKAQVSAEPACARNAAPAAAPQTYSGVALPARSTASAIPGHTPIPDVVAAVNGHSISRDELAVECRIHYGKEVLESMVNKYLILSECRQMGITISRREVDEEIEQMAKSFSLPVEQWMKLLEQERGIKPEQYANDIIWPSLALRKLAGERLRVTPEGTDRSLRDGIRRGRQGAADRVHHRGEGPEGPGPGRGQSGRVRQPGQAVFGRRPQRQHQGPGPADPQAWPLPGNRRGRLRTGRRPGFRGHPQRGSIRDPEARRPDCRPPDHHGPGRPALGEDHSRPQDAASGHRDLPGIAKEIPRAECLQRSATPPAGGRGRGRAGERLADLSPPTGRRVHHAPWHRRAARRDRPADAGTGLQAAPGDRFGAGDRRGDRPCGRANDQALARRLARREGLAGAGHASSKAFRSIPTAAKWFGPPWP